MIGLMLYNSYLICKKPLINELQDIIEGHFSLQEIHAISVKYHFTKSLHCTGISRCAILVMLCLISHLPVCKTAFLCVILFHWCSRLFWWQAKKKKIGVFTVTRPTLIFSCRPYLFFHQNFLKHLFFTPSLRTLKVFC